MLPVVAIDAQSCPSNRQSKLRDNVKSDRETRDVTDHGSSAQVCPSSAATVAMFLGVGDLWETVE